MDGKESEEVVVVGESLSGVEPGGEGRKDYDMIHKVR